MFVDAGYLFAAGTKELFGEQLKREDVSLNYVAVEEKLRLAAEEHSKLDLLRIYWYDGAYLHPTTQHTELARLSNVKVRLGLINSRGEQKGVDSLIVTDMITLARNRAMDSCMLLTGDEDIRVGCSWPKNMVFGFICWVSSLQRVTNPTFCAKKLMLSTYGNRLI